MPNVARGTNRIIHNAMPTVIPVAIPRLDLKSVTLCRNIANCPKIFPATIPVSTCRANPMYWAVVGPVRPKEVPITPKNVPAGVPDIMSITTRSPEIADADIKPAIEQ